MNKKSLEFSDFIWKKSYITSRGALDLEEALDILWKKVPSINTSKVWEDLNFTWDYPSSWSYIDNRLQLCDLDDLDITVESEDWKQYLTEYQKFMITLYKDLLNTEDLSEYINWEISWLIKL